MCKRATPAFLEPESLGRLVLLAAAKHCLLFPRQDSGRAARWFLTKREVWECEDISSQMQRSAEVPGTAHSSGGCVYLMPVPQCEHGAPD